MRPSQEQAQASLRVVGETTGGCGNAEALTAQIVNISGRGARVVIDRPLAPGSLVRIDWEQTMLLGEVCYSEPDGAGRHALGLRLEHSLLHTESLERLRQRFAEY